VGPASAQADGGRPVALALASGDAFSEACPIRRFGFLRDSGFLLPPLRIGFALRAPAAGAVHAGLVSVPAWSQSAARLAGGRDAILPAGLSRAGCIP
jgi:hypothetical protein